MLYPCLFVQNCLVFFYLFHSLVFRTANTVYKMQHGAPTDHDCNNTLPEMSAVVVIHIYLCLIKLIYSTTYRVQNQQLNLPVNNRMHGPGVIYVGSIVMRKTVRSVYCSYCIYLVLL